MDGVARDSEGKTCKIRDCMSVDRAADTGQYWREENGLLWDGQRKQKQEENKKPSLIERSLFLAVFRNANI